MKKLTFGIVCLMGLFLLAVQPTQAITLTNGDWVYLASYNSIMGGGIMTYYVAPPNATQPTSTSNLPTINTFCIQENTNISPGTWYRTDISTTVGPYNPVHSGEGQLNEIVDYLIYRYATGAYDSNFNSNAQDQAYFQELLWNLQGTGLQTFILPSSIFTDQWYKDYTDYKSGLYGTGNHWGTEVLNIYDQNGNDVQNQLVYVPEPTTLLLLGFGLIGMSSLRRKLKKKSA